jgi:hypothetical protein
MQGAANSAAQTKEGLQALKAVKQIQERGSLGHIAALVKELWTGDKALAGQAIDEALEAAKATAGKEPAK